MNTDEGDDVSDFRLVTLPGRAGDAELAPAPRLPLARLRWVCLNLLSRRGDSLDPVIFAHQSGMHGPVVGRP